MNPRKNEVFLGRKLKKDQSSDENSAEEDNLNPNAENRNCRNGRWGKKEHLRFLKGCLLHGNNWKKVNFTFFVFFLLRLPHNKSTIKSTFIL